VSVVPTIPCAACGALNRVPEARLGTPARCGRCKAPLGAPGVPLAVTDATFDTAVLGASLPVLLDCWAAWCAPCRAVAPTIDALAREWAGRVLVAKLDVDANPRVAAQLGIQSIPTLLILDRGRVVDRMVGAQPRPAIEARLRSLVRAAG
jgi:thioredoxin 2